MIKTLLKQLALITFFFLSLVVLTYANFDDITGSTIPDLRDIEEIDIEGFLEQPLKTLGEAFSYPGEDMYMNIYEGLKTRTEAESLAATSEKYGYAPKELTQILGGSITPILSRYQAGFDPLSQQGVNDEDSIRSPLLTQEQSKDLTVRSELTLEQATAIVQQIRNDFENNLTLFQLQNDVKVVTQVQSIFADGSVDNSGFDIVQDLKNMQKILFGSRSDVKADNKEAAVVANQSRMIEALLSGNTDNINDFGVLEARNNDRLKNSLYNSIKNDTDLRNRVINANDAGFEIAGFEVSANNLQCTAANVILGAIEQEENQDCGLPVTEDIRLVVEKSRLRPGESTRVFAAIMTTDVTNNEIQRALENPPEGINTSRFNTSNQKVNVLDFKTNIKLQESNPNKLKLSPNSKKVNYGITEFTITAPENIEATETSLRAYTSNGLVIESQPISIILESTDLDDQTSVQQPIEEENHNQIFNPLACFEGDDFSDIIQEARTVESEQDQERNTPESEEQDFREITQAIASEPEFDEISPAESCNWNRSAQFCAGQDTNTCADVTRKYLEDVPEEARSQFFGIDSIENTLNSIDPELLTVRANFCLEVEFIDRPQSSYPEEESCIQCNVQDINDTIQEVLEHNILPGKATGNLGESAICKKYSFGDSFSFDFFFHSKPIMTPPNDNFVFSSDPFKELIQFVAAYNPVKPINLKKDDPTYFKEENPGTPTYEQEVTQQFFRSVQAGRSIDIVFTELNDRVQDIRIRQEEEIKNLQTASSVQSKSEFFGPLITEMRSMNSYFAKFQENLLELNRVCSEALNKPYSKDL